MTHPPDHSEWRNEGEATQEIEKIVMHWCHERALADERPAKAYTDPSWNRPPTVRDLADRIVAKLESRGSVLR